MPDMPGLIWTGSEERLISIEQPIMIPALSDEVAALPSGSARSTVRWRFNRN